MYYKPREKILKRTQTKLSPWPLAAAAHNLKDVKGFRGQGNFLFLKMLPCWE
jgi:hypothetical protein